MGDERTYEDAIAVRCVTSVDDDGIGAAQRVESLRGHLPDASGCPMS